MATSSVITNAGQNLALYRTFTQTPTQSSPLRFKISAKTSTPSESDSSVVRPLLMNATTLSAMDTTTSWSSSGVGTGPTTNTTAGQRVEGSGSLNFTSSNSGTGTWYYTRTATNMASMNHNIMYFNENVTNNLQNNASTFQVTLGNNSTNANSVTFLMARSDLADGWNHVSFYTPNANVTTGTPTMASISYFGITTLLSSTMTGSAQRADIWKFGASSDVYQTFQNNGSVSFDTVLKQASMEGYLTSTQANNESISAWWRVNSDTTEIVWSEDVTTVVDKSSSEEVSIVWVDQASQGS